MHEQRLSSGRRVRIGPWQGATDVMMITTFADLPLGRHDVEELTARLEHLGVRRIITAALSPAETSGFDVCGFTVARRLVLLKRIIDEPVRVPRVGIRRWRRRDLGPILAVDNAAFDEFWAFDEVALRDAMTATPHRALRYIRSGVEPTGYALTGLSGSRGYLQRLAVHPDAADQGLGSALVADSLRWLRWHGATEAFVNTQADNVRALSLYERFGFAPQPDGLVILEYELGPASTHRDGP